jgi:ferric-dicitrate binding protein FerR (iron transport regulator)
MSHLTDERLFELGLSVDVEPTVEEISHLTGCSACADALARERALTARLEQIELPAAPREFVSGAVQLFEATRRQRQARATIVALALALVSGLAICVPLVGIVLANLGSVLHGAAIAAQETVVLLDALTVVLSKVPAVPIALLACCGAAGLLSAGLLNRAAGATAVVK